MDEAGYYAAVRNCLEGARNGRFCAGAEEAAARIKELQDKLHQLSEDHSHCEDLLHELGARASSAESRLDSSEAERRDLHAVVSRLNRERADALKRLEDAEARLNGIKALRVEMSDLIGSDLDATLQGLLWPKDVEIPRKNSDGT